MKDSVRTILEFIGEDPAREGLKDTPERMEKSMAFLTQGYKQCPEEVIGRAIFHESYDEMVVVRDIDFYSMCEHHLLPFFGKAHVAYIPNGKIVGLSKIPRMVDVFARRLQVQERMTQEVAQTLVDMLEPQGVAVVVEGFHMCMAMRGVQKQNSWMTTSAMRGVFQTSTRTREEFLQLIKGISK
ncbi:GTP cyclohydrolase I FolE [bacterium]|jgi:GTP cyclohydrolase IA|nr:GTP cyclohydrolase I FolE [bacterium]